MITHRLTETAMPLRCSERRRRCALALAWRLCLLAGAGAASVSAPGAQAQVGGSVRGGLPAPGDGFTWERVGDVGLEVFDLAVGADSTLWACGSDGPYRLDLSGGFPGEWVLLSDFSLPDLILPLGSDTLVTVTSRTYRSTDGGQTWMQVHDEGEDALYEVPAGYPFAGRILVGDDTAVIYSTNRAASFTASVIPDLNGSPAGADDFVALPPGSSHPGRILAAGRWGVHYSDDGGQTFQASAPWGDYVSHALDAVALPGRAARVGVEHLGLVEGAGGVGAVMTGRTGGEARVWASADEGETWEGGLHLLEGPPNSGSPRAMLAVGGPSALVVLRGGTIYRTDDAGDTWAPIGRAPEISTFITARSAALDAEGRLYVGLVDLGTTRGWVWRTAERVTVAVETAAEPVNPPVVIGPEGGSFQFTVRLTNMTTQPQAVEAWSAVTGPVAREPVVGPRAVTLSPGQSVARTLRQQVPGAAPAGTYTYAVRAGTFPGVVVSADSFTVEKQGASAASGEAEGWVVSEGSLSGVEGWEAPAAPEAAGMPLMVTPNPFREATEVRLTLAEPSETTVALYDVLGRRVALLHEGPLDAGRHAFALAPGSGADSVGLPPGVYVVHVTAGRARVAQAVTRLR
jgi:photosystem II stability/assembly factor-like uncharacterized protein